MRTPLQLHSWCGSVLALAIVALLLMSSESAQAAGEVGDEGFIQAVIDGRKDAREAYEHADQIDRVNVTEKSRRREREASDRRAGADVSPSGRPVSDGEPASEDVGGGFPWVYVLLGAASLGALIFIRIRRDR